MTMSLFDEELRFCPSCDGYVKYLRSPVACYCVECGEVAVLLSPADLKDLRGSAKGARSDGGQPKRWNDGDDIAIRGFTG